MDAGSPIWLRKCTLPILVIFGHVRTVPFTRKTYPFRPVHRSVQPSPLPTLQPSPLPTPQPSGIPTPQPSSLPTLQPSPLPTPEPSPVPTPEKRCPAYAFPEGVVGDPESDAGACTDGVALSAYSNTACGLRCTEGYVVESE